MFIELTNRTSTGNIKISFKVKGISVIDECEYGGCNIQVYNTVYGVSESYIYVKDILEKYASKK